MPILSSTNLVQPTSGGGGIRYVCNSDTAPVVTDDASKGFAVGSLWLRISTAKLYVLTDSTAGAAVWTILN